MENINITVIAPVVWAVLAVIGRWLLFRKAGKPGWHSIIPLLSDFQEYDICWKGGKFLLVLLLTAAAGFCTSLGTDNTWPMVVAGVAGLWVLVIHLRESLKLARSFGKGTLAGILLFIFDRLGRVVLGLSGAKYVGKRG